MNPERYPRHILLCVAGRCYTHYICSTQWR